MADDTQCPDPVLRSDAPVTLVGGAPVPAADLAWALRRAPRVVAADGGAETVLAHGAVPEAVIGDMDSLDAGIARRLTGSRLVRVAEQDSTDFEKCLDRIEAPLVIGLGFLGARVDHTLAALACITRRQSVCLLIGPRDVAFAAIRDLTLDLPLGSRLSLFPFASVTGRSEGLQWPISGLVLSPAGRIGTSNRVTGPVRLSFDAPGMAVLLPAEARDAALTALTALTDR